MLLLGWNALAKVNMCHVGNKVVKRGGRVVKLLWL